MSGGRTARKKHVRQSSIEITRRAGRSVMTSSLDEPPSLDESTLDEDEEEEELDAEFGDETGNESSSHQAHVVLEAASAPGDAPSSQPVEVTKYPVEFLSSQQRPLQ